MRKLILDIVKHTGGLGFIDVVKVTGDPDNKSTLIECMDEEKTVIVKGYLKNHEPAFDGTFGMSRLNVLKGFAEFPNYKSDDAKITVKTRERNGDKYPEEIVFTDPQGQTSRYRLMNADIVPNQAKFVGADWNVTFVPTKSKIQEFSQLAGIMSQFETYFLPKTVDNQVRFYIGEEQSASHGTFVIMDDENDGKLTTDLYWPIQQVLSILKLDNNAENTTISIANAGAMQIEIESEFANWVYLLPARMK